MAVVRKRRFAQITGVDMPRPGTSSFQRTLVVSLHVNGTVASATPVWFGPRQCGQLAAERVWAVRVAVVKRAKTVGNTGRIDIREFWHGLGVPVLQSARRKGHFWPATGVRSRRWSLYGSTAGHYQAVGE